MRLLSVLTALALVLIMGSSLPGFAQRYDASLGTLPEAQGFTRVDTGEAPNPTVSGGILHQGPTSGAIPNGNQYWKAPSVLVNFDNFVMEARLKIIFSNYVPDGGGAPGYDRYGYYFQIGDKDEHFFTIGLTSDGPGPRNGIAITSDDAASRGSGVPLTAFDTTDDFHIYRFEVKNGQGSLFIDHNLFASTPIGAAYPGLGVSNYVLFGDGSSTGISESELTYFQIGTDATPEPGAIAFFGALILSGVVGLKRLRNRFRTTKSAE
jgi:hypothetical protein